MKKEAEDPPQLGASRKNKSIPELISTLRTAFRTEDFDRVEEILMGKETEMKREMEKERDFHRIEKVKLETELKKTKQNYEKLLEKVKKGVVDDTTTIDELRKKNSELEAAKNGAEEELHWWMSRYEERVSRLEEEIKMLNSSTAVERSGPTEVIQGDRGDDNDRNGNGDSVRVPSEETVASNCNEIAKIEPNVVSPPHPPTQGKGGIFGNLIDFGSFFFLKIYF